MEKEQQAIAYRIARLVRSGDMTQKDGAEELHRDIGIKISSAGFVIYVYLHMCRGDRYKRALSATDSEFLLEKIAEDDGLDSLQLALEAFRLHIEYREASGVVQYSNRSLLREKEQWLQQERNSLVNEPIDVNELNQQFSDKIKRAQQDSIEARQERLRSARKKPQRISRMVSFLQRNADVVAEVLFQAKGTCRRCGSKAPFYRRSDGSPYLEVHHSTPLAEGGDDTVENAIALCPNCHRRSHFGSIEPDPVSGAE